MEGDVVTKGDPDDRSKYGQVRIVTCDICLHDHPDRICYCGCEDWSPILLPFQYQKTQPKPVVDKWAALGALAIGVLMLVVILWLGGKA